MTRTQVKFMGMSERVGVRTFHAAPDAQDVSQSASEAVDSEIRRLLQESYERARKLLKSREQELKSLADALLRFETLDAEDVRRVVEGKEPRVAGSNRKSLLELPRIPKPAAGHAFQL